MTPAKAQYRPGISQPSEGLGGVWLYMDLDYFSQLAKYPVYPVLLLLDEKSEHGFIRQWPIFKANTEMHFAYAIQWFAFAIFSFSAYLWFGFKKVNKKT